MNWYVDVLKKYAVFNGRARRKEYWMFVLFNLIITIVLGGIEKFLGIASYMSAIYALAVLLPGIAVSVRRLHDTNRSGLWMFLALIPIIGAIVLLIITIFDSQQGENQYGQNPKAGIA